MSEQVSDYRQSMLTRIETKFQKAPTELDSWLISFTSDIAQTETTEWWKPLFRGLEYLPSDFAEYGARVRSTVKQLLREPGYTEELTVLAAVNAITNEFQMTNPFEGLSTHTVHSLPLDDLFAAYPNLDPRITDNGIVIPPTGVVIKGGESRTLLKKIAGAPDALLDKELPLNDVDYIVTDRAALPDMATTNDVINLQLEFGRDPDDLLTQADVTMNCALVTNTSLIISEEAMEDARKGHVRSNYHGRRGFYGDDFLIKDGKVYPTPSQTFRLMKLVAEKKAVSLDYPVEGTKGLDLYWLVALNRYKNRSDFIPTMQRYFHLAQRMGIPTHGQDFMDTVVEIFEKNKFFSFQGSAPPDPSFYYLTKVVGHIHDHFLALQGPQPEEVHLPTMQTIILPEELEIDTQSLSNKYANFERKLDERSRK